MGIGTQTARFTGDMGQVVFFKEIKNADMGLTRTRYDNWSSNPNDFTVWAKSIGFLDAGFSGTPFDKWYDPEVPCLILQISANTGYVWFKTLPYCIVKFKDETWPETLIYKADGDGIICIRTDGTSWVDTPDDGKERHLLPTEEINLGTQLQTTYRLGGVGDSRTFLDYIKLTNNSLSSTTKTSGFTWQEVSSTSLGNYGINNKQFNILTQPDNASTWGEEGYTFSNKQDYKGNNNPSTNSKKFQYWAVPQTNVVVIADFVLTQEPTIQIIDDTTFKVNDYTFSKKPEQNVYIIRREGATGSLNPTVLETTYDNATWVDTWLSDNSPLKVGFVYVGNDVGGRDTAAVIKPKSNITLTLSGNTRVSYKKNEERTWTTPTTDVPSIFSSFISKASKTYNIVTPSYYEVGVNGTATESSWVEFYKNGEKSKVTLSYDGGDYAAQIDTRSYTFTSNITISYHKIKLTAPNLNEVTANGNITYGYGVRDSVYGNYYSSRKETFFNTVATFDGVSNILNAFLYSKSFFEGRDDNKFFSTYFEQSRVFIYARNIEMYTRLYMSVGGSSASTLYAVAIL